ncbi:BOI-related E3 ubiquitin-protein ligase 1 isoform X2 [Prosopis cineraria]|uniref:BOI-related E3 ubiquitin-protein ligase 1 isoform X2 n=1 Tax=Prosopis cineraria TaxID=364024 RepID=UPI00240F321F|nr:BOI-related E3 ubiquitin-protein ligase 1 isoform X2 [Prosopis cineraria]
MAVEARHIHLFPPQFLPNSDLCNAQMDSALPLPPLMSSAMADPFLPFYQSTVCDIASAKTSMNKADSGLTCHIPAVPNRKRPRDQLIAESNALSVPHKINKLSCPSSSFLDQDILCQLQNQQSEIDHFISQHTEKMRMELQKQRVRQSTVLISGIQEAMAKKLKEKDEEIQRMGKMNWALQERVKSLCVENQIWRELAQTNEATANSLRSNLEQILAHVGEERQSYGGTGPQADDAESSCGSTDEDDDEGRCTNAAAAATSAGMMCKKCGLRESIVLLLPCRHLCLCTMCGSTVRNCPVCNSGMNTTVHVNFS